MKKTLAMILVGSISLSLLAACSPDGEPAETPITMQPQTSAPDSAEPVTTSLDAAADATVPIVSETEAIDSPDAGITDREPSAQAPDEGDGVYIPSTDNPWELYAESPLIVMAMLFDSRKLPDGRLESVIPSYIVSEVIEEELEKNDDAFGKYESMKRNSDGSITITYSKAEHERMLNTIKDGLHQIFDQSKEAFTSYRTLEYNDTMTEVKVLVDKGQWREFDALGAMGMTSLIMIYHIYSGDSENMDNFTLNFVDDKTGEVVYSGIE